MTEHAVEEKSPETTVRAPSPDLLEELASASVGVKSLLVLAQPKQAGRLTTQRLSQSQSVPALLEELAGSPIGLESLLALAQQIQHVRLTPDRVSLSPSVSNLLEELADGLRSVQVR